MLIIECSHGAHIAKEVARKLNAEYSKLVADKFPDGESYIRFNKNVKSKHIVLVQSFYHEINDCLVEVIFAAKTARDLGAKKISLLSPYFPYLRQDKRFKEGESISIQIVGKLIDMFFDEIYIINPHLHRENKLSEIFKIKSHQLNLNKEISKYILKNYSNPFLIGPDSESYRWVDEIRKLMGCRSLIFEKERINPRKVIIKNNPCIEDIKNKEVIIIDDIISTGDTILETVKKIKRLEPKKIICICIHGIFSDNSFDKIKKSGADIISSNSIPNKASKINVSNVLVESLSKSS